MKRCLCSVLFGSAVFCTGVVAAPKEADVQGLYEGTCRKGQDTENVDARVVALGKGAYQVLIRRSPGAGGIVRVELNGTTAGEDVAFKGQAAGVEWSATYADGTIKGSGGPDCTLELSRVRRKSPTLGKAPPPGAVVLLDGTKLDEMLRPHGRKWYVGDMSQDGWTVWEVPIRMIAPKEPAAWPSADTPIPEGWTLTGERCKVDTVLGVPEDGSLQVPGGGMQSKRGFDCSFDLHVEFMCPLRAEQRSQGRGNSGVFFPNGTEIQVLDSFGMTTYLGGGCGGFYKWKNPDTMEPIPSLGDRKDNVFNLSCLPPLEWQTYDIESRVRPDANGSPAVFVTAYHNGVKIHDNVKLHRSPRKGNFSFQDHGNPVRYRNIWVLPVKGQ